MVERVLFARVGWMLWYRGVQPDDPKPIGGGAYNEYEIGGEQFNFPPMTATSGIFSLSCSRRRDGRQTLRPSILRKLNPAVLRTNWDMFSSSSSLETRMKAVSLSWVGIEMQLSIGIGKSQTYRQGIR